MFCLELLEKQLHFSIKKDEMIANNEQTFKKSYTFFK